MTDQPKPCAVVWAVVDLPGFHAWPDAPPERDYLRERHRHLFRVTPEVRVSHGDRDVEFHDLGDLVRDWWHGRTRDRSRPDTVEWGSCSCEAIADNLAAALTRAGLTVARVTVSEDGETGATITYPEASCS